MEKYIWRMVTSLFVLMAALVLGLFAFLFQGSAFLMGICFYGALFLGLVGMAMGVIVLIDYHKEHKDQE